MSTIYRDYDLTYTVDASQAVPALNNIASRLVNVDRQALQTKGGVDQLNASLHGLSQTAASVVMPAMQGAGGAAQGLGQSILGIGASWFVMNQGIELLTQFAEISNKARDRMSELGEKVREMRDDWREIANLKGESGPDDSVVAEVIGQGVKTGMMPDEARRYMQEFLGSVPAGKQKGNITDDLVPQVAEEGMRFGNRLGLTPKTAGDFTGVMSQYGKIESAEHAAQIMGQVSYGLNEGRGSSEALMRSLIKTAGAVTGDGAPIGTIQEQAALQGVASTHANPDASGTKIRKAVTELRDFGGKQGPALERLGIKPTDTYMQALRKIAPGVLKADKDGTGGDQYLSGLGFNDVSGRVAVMEQARDLETIEQRLKKMATITGRSVQTSNENYMQNDINGISRRIKAGSAAQEYVLGVKSEKLNIGREASKTQMADKGEFGGFANEAMAFIQDFGGIKRGLFGFRGAKDRWLDENSFKIAQQTAYQAKLNQGLSVAEAIDAMGKEFPGSFNATRAKEGATEFTSSYINRRTRQGIPSAQAEREATAAARRAPLERFGGLDEYWLTDAHRKQEFNKLADSNARIGTGSGNYANNDKMIADHLATLVHEQKTTNSLLAARQSILASGGMSNPLAIANEAGKAAVAPTR